jgi:hypothetical protein
LSNAASPAEAATEAPLATTAADLAAACISGNFRNAASPAEAATVAQPAEAVDAMAIVYISVVCLYLS